MEKENKDINETEDVKDTENVKETSDEEVKVETKEEQPETEASKKEETSETEEKPEKKKKKGFKKKDKKDEQIEELNDKYQRLFAEFQNFRSRSDKEKTAFETGARSIIEKILPVVDNFERGVAALSEEDLESPVGQGMNLIYKQLLQTLEDIGVEAIEAQGKEFDPELHNAVMHEDNDELGENVVSEELQKGYKYRDTVVRHSMVKVAN